MKTKEEIEQLAERWLAETPIKEWGGVENGYIKGYTQCQEDNDWTKGCECESSIGQTWCCNQCGLPYDTRKSDKKYTEEDIINIVNKSRETGLTAEYLILSLNKQDNK